MTRLNLYSLWAALLALAVILYLKSERNPAVTELGEQIQVMQEQVNRLSRLANSADATGENLPQSSIANRLHELEGRIHAVMTTAPAPGGSNEPGTQTSQALFSELMTQAGAVNYAAQPEDLRPPGTDASQVNSRLLDRFNTSQLARSALVTHSGCDGSRCTIEIGFNDARTAIEQESPLLSWLSSADNACSFTLTPLTQNLSDVNVVRQISIDCG